MTTTATLSLSAPTHRAFFPGIPGAAIEFDAAGGLDPVTALVNRYPDAGVPKIEALAPRTIAPVVHLAAGEIAKEMPGVLLPESVQSLGNSEFGGALVTDGAAKTRIEAQHAALAASGVEVDTSKQLFATGTRMADVGYQAQEKRAREHERKMPLRDAAEQLAEVVRAERREDVTCTAGELARAVEVNGKLRVGGYSMQEQAIRGLLARIDSPAGKYVFGLRERIVARLATLTDKPELALHVREQNALDKAELAHVLSHELGMAGGERLVLRTRKLADGTSDAFAAVSPKYAPADAPEVIAQILRALPGDAKGSYSYDPSTTSWELRAELWTSTPVAEQAVGEPFRGYVSFRSRDDGTGSLRGGGGIEIIACLNASTYVAGSADVERRHIGKIVAEAEKMIASAKRSIDALCAAWGRAREAEVVLPAEFESQVGMPISKAIPGFWWGTLQDRKSELQGVLPGRTKAHVAGLTDAYFAERRDPSRIVRADFAHAWTRYVQGQPSAVRRDAEAAIASWTVSGRMPKFDGDRVEA